jgi:glycosyltransferase involved in cell wall biosynthesis
MNRGRLGIGILVTYLPKDRAGGAQLQAVRMAAELSRQHDVILFTRGDADCARGLDLGNARLVTRRALNISGVRLFADSWVGLRQIRQVSDRLDVLVGYQSLAAGYLGVLAKRRLGLPCLVFVRGRMEYQMGQLSQFRLLVPNVFRRADRVLVQAEPLAAEILAQFDRPGLRRIRESLHHRIGIVPNGVDLQPPRGAALGGAIVYAGRLITAKGLDELLDAMHRLAGQRLTIVGDGPERERLQRRARGLPVSFTGHVDHATARRHVAEARCLVLPSHTEAFPNVVLEAMAAGVPVVAARSGGVPALVQDGETGLLVDVGNVEQLATALRAIATDDGLCARMGARAHEAARGYSWQRATERLVDEIHLALRGQDQRA